MRDRHRRFGLPLGTAARRQSRRLYDERVGRIRRDAMSEVSFELQNRDWTGSHVVRANDGIAFPLSDPDMSNLSRWPRHSTRNELLRRWLAERTRRLRF